MHLWVAQIFRGIYIPLRKIKYHNVVQNLLPYITYYVNSNYHNVIY